MCLAIFAPVGVTIARDRLSHGWDNNPDGGGYAFINEFGEITVRKFMHWSDFIRGYERDHAANTKSPFIIHERLATHGTTNEFNIHPFWLDEYTVVMHNGVLTCNMTDKKRSDTRTFVEDYLTKFPVGWMDDPALVDLVEDYIRGSKLVMLTTDPAAKHNVYVFNEKDGHWDRGAWWSNSGYRPRLKLHGYGMGYTVKAGGKTGAKKAGGKVTGTQYRSSVSASGKHTGWWETYDEEANWPEAPFDTDRHGDTVCWLCAENTHFGPVCFTCEWCEECQQEFWTCDHINDQDVVNEYVEWWNNRDDEMREFDREYLEQGLEVVTDPEVVKSIESKIRKA